jgi:prevent-host-death family protein
LSLVKSIELAKEPALLSILDAVNHGGEILLTHHSLPVARVVPVEPPAPKRKAKAGLWKGLPGFWVAPDFDAPLEDFRAYTE